ncbi:MAG: FAD:protein FMN transferase [Phycisphaeraceae bacterium]|nr:FAD:protein FMN transferase [Phycisphaeraceae bacterium]
MLAAITVNAYAADPLVLVEVTQVHMGMPVHLRVYAPDEQTGRAACRAAFERIAQLNQILSDYEPDSELSQLVRQAGSHPVPVSEDLFTVLAAAQHLAEQSDSLLDPTAAPLIRLWRKARAEHQLPDPDALRTAQQLVGFPLMKLDETHRTVQLLRPGMLLDLGAIAKGYVGDQALLVLRQHHLTRAMFEAGGDMVFADPPPPPPEVDSPTPQENSGWLVRPESDQLPELRLANCAAAISGDSVQYTIINHRRFGHIIDPRTAQPTQTHRTCLVVAPTGLTADPLATLGTIMVPQDYQALLARSYPQVRVWFANQPAEETTAPSSENPS